MLYKITKYEESPNSLFVCIISKNNPVYIKHDFTDDERKDDESILNTIQRLIAELTILDEEYVKPESIISKFEEAQNIQIDMDIVNALKESIIKDNNKITIDDPPEYNPLFEKLVVGEFTYDSTSNIEEREYTIELLDFPLALTKCFSVLDKNRYEYEIGGFVYNYYGTEVIILTDQESSQPKLIAAEITASKGTRTDTDVWKFIKADDQSNIVVQLSNEDLLLMTEFVFRKIQDSYNLQSQIAWQMLGCENTSTLKEQIINGIINLNPYV